MVFHPWVVQLEDCIHGLVYSSPIGGYRNWALAGANFFPVSKQSMVILRNAGVPEQRVAPVIWGPMVDRTQFRVDLPEDKVLETRKRLTFGMQPCFLMIYVGRVTAEKDIQFLVDAHKRAPKHVVLALIGPGSMAGELKQFHGPEHRLQLWCIDLQHV